MRGSLEAMVWEEGQVAWGKEQLLTLGSLLCCSDHSLHLLTPYDMTHVTNPWVFVRKVS